MQNKSELNLQMFTNETSQSGMMQSLSTLYHLLTLVENGINPDGEKQKLMWSFWNRKEKGVDVLLGEVALAEQKSLVRGGQVGSTEETPVMVTISQSNNIYIFPDSIGGKFRRENRTVEQAAADIIKDLKGE